MDRSLTTSILNSSRSVQQSVASNPSPPGAVCEESRGGEWGGGEVHWYSPQVAVSPTWGSEKSLSFLFPLDSCVCVCVCLNVSVFGYILLGVCRYYVAVYISLPRQINQNGPGILIPEEERERWERGKRRVRGKAGCINIYETVWVIPPEAVCVCVFVYVCVLKNLSTTLVPSCILYMHVWVRVRLCLIVCDGSVGETYSWRCQFPCEMTRTRFETFHRGRISRRAKCCKI